MICFLTFSLSKSFESTKSQKTVSPRKRKPLKKRKRTSKRGSVHRRNPFPAKNNPNRFEISFLIFRFIVAIVSVYKKHQKSQLKESSLHRQWSIFSNLHSSVLYILNKNEINNGYNISRLVLVSFPFLILILFYRFSGTFFLVQIFNKY